jgi:hypothetical protein
MVIHNLEPLILSSFPPLVGGGYLGRQARNLFLNHILSLAHGHKLIFQKKDPLGHPGCLIMGGCQQHTFSQAIPSA